MANEIFGEKRDTVRFADVAALKDARNIIADSRRSRPNWFDGRFLTARDLKREQNYFLTRLMDVSRASGAGIVRGLDLAVVEPVGRTRSRFVVTAGHGVTFDGQNLVLPSDASVDIAEIPVVESVNAKLGLSQKPAPSLRSQSGLFVVALRPVEFTANQISAYPTQIDGERRLEDGEIVEAVAITAVPFRLLRPSLDAWRMRALAGHQIFVEEASLGMPASSLPIAMLALDHGAIVWADQHLVRREIFQSGRDITGLRFAQDQARVAHYRHYFDLFSDIAAEQAAAMGAVKFRAEDYFQSLPPTGPLPTSAVNGTDFTQDFFPPQMDVDLSVVPQDELTPLVEEAVQLPPIDLSRGPESENVSIMILLPLPRADFYRLAPTLDPLVRSIPPAASIGYSRATPKEQLGRLTLSSTRLERLSGPLALSASQTAWQEAIGKAAGALWYARRRNVSYRSDIVGLLTGPTEGGSPGDGGGGATEDAALNARLESLATRLAVDSEPLAGQVRSAYEAAPSAAVRTPYVSLLERAAVFASPINVAAVAQRLIDLGPQQESKMQQVLRDFLGANMVGMALLDKALLDGHRNLTDDVLKSIRPVTRYEALPALSVRLAANEGSELDVRLKDLRDFLDAGSADEATKLLEELTEKGVGVISDFVSSVRRVSSKRRVMTVLEGAKPARRDQIIANFKNTGASESRVAVAQVQTNLGRLDNLSEARVNKAFTGLTPEGVKATVEFERFLLDANAGGTVSPIITPAIDERADARLQRIVEAKQTGAVVEIASLLKNDSARAEIGKTLIEVLDKSGSSTRDVTAAFTEIVEKLQPG